MRLGSSCVRVVPVVVTVGVIMISAGLSACTAVDPGLGVEPVERPSTGDRPEQPSARSSPPVPATGFESAGPELAAPRPATSRPWLVYEVPPVDAVVGASPHAGTFSLRSGCVVFDNEHDQSSYLVAVVEGGGRPADDGRAIQLPRYRITLDSAVRYQVVGWSIGAPDAGFLAALPAGCPAQAFLVLEVGLAPGEDAPGTMVAMVVGCDDEPLGSDCGLRIANDGRVWVDADDADPLDRVTLRSSQVDGLAEGASLWSTARPDRLLLFDPTTERHRPLAPAE